MTLLEMAISIAMVAFVLELGATALNQISKYARAEAQPARIIDLACDRLRRDLERGGRIHGGDLVAGGVRWRVVEGRLMRGAVRTCHVQSAEWTSDGRTIQVVLQPVGLPRREVRACP
ncbi:MAG: hypothetical protein H0V44_15295 [Planctomycetes bacterium]|nr:hypothetical protein [Planctomycetota bacterium]